MHELYRWSNSIITSRPEGRWVYKFFVILRDGKLGGRVVLDQSPWHHGKKIPIKHFCIIKEKIAYMECAIQTSMFYSFYLFLSILRCNVDSALVSDSNAYIWISHYIQMFELYSMFEFIFECWRDVLLVHALEKWHLEMMLTRKYHSFTKS